MISITDIKVSKSYRDGEYWQPHYEAKLAIRLPDTYSDQWITLSEESADRVVALIVELASQDLRFDHYVPRKPEPVEDELISPPTEQNMPLSMPADVLEPL